MLTPTALLADLDRRGVRLVVRAGRIFAPVGMLDEVDKAQLRALKPELLALLAERQAHAALDCYLERQAIAEVDGGLVPSAAEALARRELLEGLAFTHYEVAALGPRGWSAEDLVGLGVLRTMTGGEVVPLPTELERLTCSELPKNKMRSEPNKHAA